MVLGAQNAFWSSKRVLEHFGDFGSPEPSINDSVYHYKNGPSKIGEHLAPKVLFGTTWATWGPPEAQGWLAGWLRAQSSGLRAQS